MQIRHLLRPWMVVAAIWLAPAVFAAINQVAQRRIYGDPPATLRELLWTGGDWLVYAIITPAVFWVSSRWPLAGPHLSRRAAQHMAFALLFCVIWAVGGKILEASLAIVLAPQALRGSINAAGDEFLAQATRDVLSWIFTTLPFGVVVYLCVMGAAHAIQYFTESSEREVQLARLSEQLAGARFAALQAQLNPHFLFNTLNTIAVRARDGDRAGTVWMVEQLSDVLRRTLRRHRANEVPLAEELELVQQYLAIEQARFSDRLRVSFDVEESIRSAAVPSFALQHLVENAIRHGITKRPGAGSVRVAGRRRGGDTIELTVTDDGPGFDTHRAMPRGHGIENTRERLHALYGERASLLLGSVEPTGTAATLRLPCREVALESDIAER